MKISSSPPSVSELPHPYQFKQESEKPVLGDNFERAFIAIRHQWSKCYRKGGESGWATSTLALAIEKSQADD
jgi:hypothetical protein